MTEIADDILPGPWMQTVASMLPLPRRAAMPFTLGEAVAELDHWARLARQSSWKDFKNQKSLELDRDQLSVAMGPRLNLLVQPHLDEISTLTSRADIADCADRFIDIWRQPRSISAAFRDLCEAAAQPDATSWNLRKRADILASQLGPSAFGAWSALNEAAKALAGKAFWAHSGAWFNEDESVANKSMEDRLRDAEDLLVAGPPKGDVVVWLIYRRAMAPIRTEAGPITFLWADWTIPNARREDGQRFPERNELRMLFEDEMWADRLEAASTPENRLVLARVSLGKRTVAGAVEEAERRVEAILSIAVGAGGVSWQNTGSSATIIDGRVGTRVLGSNFGTNHFDDTYGMGATSEILDDVAGKLSAAMADRPMPEYLVEALLALREAGMTDHRDVSFYGDRAVTPRFAIALQDHAMELIASIASMNSSKLAAALEEREVDRQLQQQVLGGIMAPFDHRDFADREDHQTLERVISHYDRGTRVVSVAKAVELRQDLLSLPMSALTRADLAAALKAATDPIYEADILRNHEREVKVIRARHRRVRNAVNHGNPLTTAALDSVRGFGTRTADAALGIALEAYASGTRIDSMLDTEQKTRRDQRQELAKGRNYVERSRTS